MRVYLNFFFLLCLASFWTLHIIFAKEIDEHAINAVLAILVLYSGILALFFTLLFYVKNRRLPNIRAARLFFFVTAIVGYILPVMSELFAAPNLPLASLMLITTTTPLMTLMIAWIWGLEKPSALRALGVAFGIVAVLLLIGNPVEGFSQGPFWMMVAMVMVLSYSFGDCFIERYWPKNFEIFEVASADAIVAFGLVMLLALGFQVELPQYTRIVDDHFLSIIGIVISSASSGLLFFFLVKAEGAVYVSVASYVALFIGIFAGYVFFEESLDPNFYVSTGILLSGLGLIEYTKRVRKKRDVR